jgi:hypothetical protein
MRWMNWMLAFPLAALALAACGDGSTPPPTPAPNATATAAPATTTPSVSPTATPVALPSTVAGKPVIELKPGEPVEFPDNIVLYVATSGCFNCGFGPGDLWRIYRAHDGQLVGDHVAAPPNVTTYSISPDAALLIAYVCDDYCGGEGPPSETAVGRFMASRDGGISWANVSTATFDRSYATFAGWYHGEVVANIMKYLPSNNFERVDTVLVPSMTPLAPPAPLPAPAPGTDAFPRALVGPGGRLYWTTSAGFGPPDLFDEEGRPASFEALEAIIPSVEWRDQSYGQTGWQGIAGVWFAIPGDGAGPSLFVALDSSGRPTQGLITNVDGVSFGTNVTSSAWLGTAILPLAAGEQGIPGNDNERAVLIDGETGLMHPVKGLPDYESPLWGHFSYPRLALTGDFWRVDTGTDCLNVRTAASASSASLGCFASGVLLRARDASAPAGWKAVTTPDGQDGFASTVYLK